MASNITRLSNGIKVATFNNGVKATQVGLFATNGAGTETLGSAGKHNILANCINLTSNPYVNAATSRSGTTIKSIGADGLTRIEAALKNSVNDTTVAASKELAHAQAL